MEKEHRLIRIEDYQPLIGREAAERILDKAAELRDLHVVHVNSTYYGEGVAELLSSLTLILSSVSMSALSPVKSKPFLS